MLKNQVEQILQEIPETRNSDITLMIALWKKFHLHKTIGGEGAAVRLSDLYDLPREDTIKRIRAAFNAKGMYWPTDLKIARGRGILENEWREKLGYPKVEDTKNPTKQESYTGSLSPTIPQSMIVQDDKQPELI